MFCCKHGIISATFYHGKARYGGLSVSEAKRLRALEREQARGEVSLFAAFVGSGAEQQVSFGAQTA